MSIKRGRPGSPAVRSGKRVGPDYPETNFVNPFNAGIDEVYTEGDGKRTLVGPTSTTLEGVGLPLRDDYDSYWKEGR